MFPSSTEIGLQTPSGANNTPFKSDDVDGRKKKLSSLHLKMKQSKLNTPEAEKVENVDERQNGMKQSRHDPSAHLLVHVYRAEKLMGASKGVAGRRTVDRKRTRLNYSP